MRPLIALPILAILLAFGAISASADEPAVIEGHTGFVGITEVSPSSGSTAGGTIVTVWGYGLGGATGVRFGATEVAPTSVSYRKVVAVAPAGTAGTVNVRVVLPSGMTTVTSLTKFTYVALPTISSLSPTSGPEAGGTEVTINGAGFTGASLVYFGGNSVAPTSVTPTRVKAIAPPGSGTVNVRVKAALGTSTNSSAFQFSYVGAPKVTDIVPDSGPTQGGNVVVIYGQHLQNATAVSFGGDVVSPYDVTSTSLKAVAPAHAPGAVDVRVTTPSGTSANTAADNYTYITGPVIDDIYPDSGPTSGGTTVDIYGSGFVHVYHVLVDGIEVYPSVISSGRIRITTPAHAAGVVDIRVVTKAGISPNTSADNFRYEGGPVITSVVPASGPTSGGNLVTIYGLGFLGLSHVLFGDSIAYAVSVTNTVITVYAPARPAGAVDVRVVTAGGTSQNTAADNYTYGTTAFITSISPTSGPASGGTVVTIYGGGFTGASHVEFGGTVVTATVINDSTIRVVSPAGTPGVTDIRVVTPAGKSPDTVNDNYTYTGVVPAVTGLSPSSGPDSGGTVVTINGLGLAGATQVLFGSIVVTPISVSSTSVVAIAPAGTGTVDVRVVTPNGTTGPTSQDNYSYTTTATVRFTLSFRWSLIVWTGRDGQLVEDALRGRETPDNPSTTDILNQVSVIFRWDAATQRWSAHFPGSTVPGVNDFATFTRGTAYWIAVRSSGGVVWLVTS
ncbi:MAG: IPT/TIG domain-containing protein [Dehalococcoidia bacterium]